MGMKHMITDLTTGEITVQDIPEGVDPREWMRQQMDDCPLCKEARARGEVPLSLDGAQLQEAMARATRGHRPFARRPRWRNLKRHVR